MSKLILIAFTFFLVACQVEKKTGKDEFIADHRSAKNSFTISTNHSGIFKEDTKLVFTLSFPSNVVVTGSPQLSFEFGLATRHAQFTGGNGTKNLTFEYTTQSGDDDSDGIRFQAIDLNGSTLQYYFREELTDCSTTMDAVHFSQIKVDTTGPFISSITHTLPPTDYFWKDNLTFSVNFNEAVRIKSGTPVLRLNFATGGWKEAQYVSGAGTTTLNFRYTIENNIVDSNGPSFDNSANVITGAVLEDALGNPATIAYPSEVTPTNLIRINGRVPKLVEVILPEDNTYRVSEHLDFQLVFDRAVSINGTNPYLALTVGSDNPQAILLGTDGNTLTFRYTVLPDQLDLDGITLGNTITNASSIVAGTTAMTGLSSNNNLNNPDTSKIFINATNPKITRITRGSDTTRRVDNNTYDDVWIIGQQLYLTTEFTSNIDVNINLGSPILHFSIGDEDKTASYVTGGADTNIMTFVYTIEENDKSTGDQITISHIEPNKAVVIDQYGTVADFTIPNPTINQTTIDGVRPTVNKVEIDDGYYSDEHTDSANRYLLLKTEFSEAVRFSNNNINIPLEVGAQTKPANLFSGNNTSTPQFRYTIVDGDNDADGITIQPVFNTGASYTIRDIAGNEMIDKTFTAPQTPGAIVDTTHPKAILSQEPAARVFLKGETLTLELTFDETVKIETTGGYPRFPINNLSPQRYFTPNFASGTEGTVFEFKYDVQPEDLSSNYLSLGLMQHTTGSSIRDRATNIYNVEALSFTNQIEVDAKDVTIASASGPAAGYYQKDDELEISVTFSEAVTVTGDAQITAHANGMDFVFSLTGGNNTGTLKFTHTLTSDVLHLEGLGSVAAITLGMGASIKDNHGIDAETTFDSINLSGVKLLPSKFKAWIQNPASTTDVISGSEDLFLGQMNIVDGHSLSTTVSASSILARINFTSNSGTILDGIPYAVLTEELPPPEPCEEEPCEEPVEEEPEILGIVLDNTGNEIASVYVDGNAVGSVDNKFIINKTPGTPFNLEITFTSPVSGVLFSAPDFEGQISSILLLDSSLTNSERVELD